ncbi:MAG: F0F1 ATP synthase subunit B' [Rhodobacteraceae bacterium]|nr:F0F1 ATP synthase subunit B' [Paracoccaceae bacterium]
MATETTAAGHVSPESLEAAGICIDAHGGAIGMPQLCFDWFPNQIFWLVVTLVVIFLILSRVALPRIAGILAERQGTITADIAAAEDLKAKAVEAEEAYNRALAEARTEAQRIAGEARAEIQAELDKAIARADAEIAAKSAESEKAIAEIRASALDSIEAVATDTADAIVTALGGKSDAKAISGAVSDRMKG